MNKYEYGCTVAASLAYLLLRQQDAVGCVAFDAAARAGACLVVGTTGAVYPAAQLVFDAHRGGSRVVVVDPGETAFDEVADLRFRNAAGLLLPVLLGAGH